MIRKKVCTFSVQEEFKIYIYMFHSGWAESVAMETMNMEGRLYMFTEYT